MFASEHHNFIAPARRDGRGRRRFAFLTVIAILLSTLVGAFLTSEPASAAPNLSCTAPTVYSVDQATGDGDLWAINTLTGASTKVIDLPGGDIVNQLGIAPGGTNAYFSKAGVIYNYTLATNSFVSTTATTLTGFNTVGGAVNPATGLYYYGGLGGGGSQYQLAVYNPATNTSLGIAATITLPAGTTLSNSDIAFDQNGQLYIVGSQGSEGRVFRVSGTLPTTGTNATLSATLVTSIPAVTGVSYAAIAFSGTGELYIGGGSQVLRVNATTGAILSQMPLTGAGTPNMTDFGTCATPPTLALQKSVDARLQGTDQFALAITGGGIQAGNTGLTQGTEPGRQNQSPSETAGPLIVQTGQTYNFAETPSGSTSLTNYSTTWECVNTLTEPDTVLASGTGASGTIQIPAIEGVSVLCTISNRQLVPALTLDKRVVSVTDVNTNGITDVGDSILWEFAVQNTGETPLSAVSVTDDTLAAAGIGITCNPTSLAPTESVVCTANAPYVLTQADVDNGQVVNTATATGTPPGRPAITSAPDTTTTPADMQPALELTKTAGTPVDVNGNGDVDAGDTIAYTFTVANTGNVTVSNVAVTDPKAGAVTCDLSVLAPGETATCTAAPYTIVQADVDAGAVDNTATAAGTAPNGDPVPSNEDSTTTPVVDPAPALELDKSAGTPVDVNNDGLTDAGDTIPYTFTVTNTGNVTVSNIAVTDAMAGAVSCDVTTLAPGGVATCTAAPYTITAADQDAGSVVNTATAAGTDPAGGAVPSNEDTTTTPVDTPAPALQLDKTAGTPNDVNTSGTTDVGDTIDYTFTVTNTGNVTVSSITVNDPKVGTVTCDVTTLAPTEVATCTAAPYAITQADVDNGAVENTASATGVAPNGDPVPSNEDTTNTPVEPAAPALALEKTAGVPVDVNGDGLTDAGDTIAYTFAVTNTGNVTVTDVTVSDPMVGAVTCDLTTLAPGQVANCTAAPYTITAADDTAGAVANTAVAGGTDPAGDPVPSNEDSTNTPVVPAAPALAFDKTAGAPVDTNANGITDEGDTIVYTFTVTNTGNVTVANIAVADDVVGAVTCDLTTLAPGEVATCTAGPYTVTAADEAAGEVVNTANAGGTAPNGDPVPSNDDTTNTPVEPSAPAIAIEKTAGTPVDVNGNGLTDAGDTIAYTFTVTNTGNVPLLDIVVDDPKVGAVTCDVTTLAPTEVANCTAKPYVITQADVDNGSVDNSATATGTPPGEPAVPSTPDTTTTPTDQVPALELDKSAGTPVDVNGDLLTDEGDTIAYTFTLTNTGTVTLTDLTVDDPKVGAVTCDVTALAPGEVATCTAAPYTITAEDEAAGEVANTATAAGTDPNGDPVPSNEDSTTTPVTPAAPALTLNKAAGTPVDVNGDGLTDAGDTIAYTFTVTNTGNVAVTGIAVSDPMVGAVTCDVTALAPGEVATCTAAPYAITAADEAAGAVANTAIATGTDPDGDPVPSNEDSTNTPVVASAPALELDKSAGVPVDVNANGITDEGDTIAYTFTVTNTGNVTVTDIAVDDPKAGAVTCDLTALAPGEVANCTAAPYAITADDEAAGEVVNTATASGTAPSGDPVPSNEDTTNTPVVPSDPSLTLDKTAGTPDDVNGNGLTDVGDTIAYTFTVTNTGNVPLADITVDDPKVGAVTCDVTTLAPGEVATCTAAPYVITQADVDNGSVDNSATATGTPPGEPAVPSEPDTTNTPTDQVPALELDKSAGVPVDVNGNGITDEGDTIAYTFTVTNTGNVTTTDVVVTDAMVGTITCDITTLAPGDVANCTAAPYTVTAADEAAGEIVNTATASGTDPNGDPVPSNEDSTNTPAAPSAPSLTLDKTAGTPDDVNGNGITDVGDTIAYTFTVTNTGNVPLADITVDDPKVGAVTCDVTTLAPGEVATCAAAPYVITQTDVDNGSVDNSATATGTPPGEPAVPSEPDTTNTPTDQTPALTLDKVAGTPVDVNGDGLTDAGDTIAYTFTVINTGNVTTTDIAVDDPKVGTVTCDMTALAPGETATCTAAPYTITTDDEAAGAVVNTATASGTDPNGDPVPSNDDTTETPVVPAAPALLLDKTAGVPVDVNANGITDEGDTIAYTFTVTNTGNVTVTDIAVDDPTVDAVSCDVTALAPGEVATCTAAPYTVTAADEAAGAVVNTATASGTAPSGDPVPSNEDSTNTPTADSAPALTLDKNAGTPVDVNGDGITDVGDTIAYTFIVTNTGNVPLADITVDDPKVGAVTCDVTTLAPGEVAACTAEPYVITQADLDNGSVDNSATATGTPPGEPAVPSEPDTTNTPTDQLPSITLFKVAGTPVDANANGLTDAGDTIPYTFTVTNTGNVTVTEVAVTDPLVGEVNCDVTTLAPGESASCTAEPYTITEADEAAGAVVNTATATANGPDGDPVPYDPDSTNTPVVPSAPALTLDKSAGTPVDVNGDGLTDAGDTIAYTFTVTNTGNVPLADITVDDPKVGAVTCDVTTLAPGEAANCTAEPYAITQADVDAGSADNSATATGTPPGEPAVPSEPDTTNTPTDQVPSLLFDKTAGTPVDVNGNGLTDAGDTIAYTFTVTNNGTVTITDIVVNDPMVGVVTCDSTTLAPGEVANCAAEPYTITEADEGAGAVQNTATGAGSDPGGDPLPPVPDTTNTPVIPAVPSLSIDKTAGTPVDANGNGLVDVGDTIAYTFTVTNTGNVPLSDVVVNDPKVGAVTCDLTTLAPGAVASCTAAPYVITQADVDAGAVRNTATAEGTPPGEPVVPSEPDTTETPTDQLPALTLVKSNMLEDGNGDREAEAGEVIHYAFDVTNTGNVTLTEVGIDDPLLDAAGDLITCPVTPVAPGETVTCSAEHEVTAADATGGDLVNVATATAHGGGDDPITSDPSTTTTPTDPSAPAPQPARLPTTGGSDQVALALIALALTVAGTALVVRGGRRRIHRMR